jgi:GNAT superfamily N-acetyltransferase
MPYDGNIVLPVVGRRIIRGGSTMEIRFAGPEDIDALIRLRFKFFSEEPELALSGSLETVLAGQLRRYIEEHLNKDFFVALAGEDGRLAAVSFLVIHEKPANVRFPTGKTGEILNVYTLPEHRRKGFASAALKLLIHKAREEDASFIELSASESGKYVYEKLGFIAKPSRSFTEMVLKFNQPS